MSIERIQAGPRISQAVVYNDTIYLAGQLALGAPGESVSAQTKDILARIDSLLAEAGSDKGHILAANVWLTDIGTFADMNSVWDTWIVAGSAPARATVESPHLAFPEYSIEVSVVAARVSERR